MEKRQKLAMLTILTRFVRWLEQQGALSTTSTIETDKLVQTYVKGVAKAYGAGPVTMKEGESASQ